MKNKIIVIEGTDCSGKSTQFNLINQKLKQLNVNISNFKFPAYDTPTGRIIGDNYLGKTGAGYFSEGASNVDPKVAGMLFTIDRYYNKNKLSEILKNNHLLLDRYVDSNFALNGAKIPDKKERFKFYKFFEKLEYDMLKLPKPNLSILLYMPYLYACILKQNRTEKPDQHENDEDFLKRAEKTYLEIAKRNNYVVINCVKNNKIRTIEDINEELLTIIINYLKIKAW